MNSQNTGSAASITWMGVIGKKGTLRKDCGPRKIRARYQPLGSKDLFAPPGTRMGRESGGGVGEGTPLKDTTGFRENPVAPVPQDLSGEGAQAWATLNKASVYSTPFMNSRNSVERGPRVGQR